MVMADDSAPSGVQLQDGLSGCGDSACRRYLRSPMSIRQTRTPYIDSSRRCQQGQAFLP